MYLKRLLYFFYPKRCIICDKKIDEKLSYACEKCFNVIEYMLNDTVSVEVPKMYFDKLFSLFLYKGIIRKRILEFKFRNKPYLGRLFAEVMSDFLNDKKWDFDIVIPVPMHYRRFFNRGYNQSVILAKEISNLMKKTLKLNVLRKIKKSAVQSTLNLNQRKINILNSYGIKNKKDILNKNILLVDDIYTTGATVNECSRVLKEYGARKVFVITISHGEKELVVRRNKNG